MAHHGIELTRQRRLSRSTRDRWTPADATLGGAVAAVNLEGRLLSEVEVMRPTPVPTLHAPVKQRESWEVVAVPTCQKFEEVRS